MNRTWMLILGLVLLVAGAVGFAVMAMLPGSPPAPGCPGGVCADDPIGTAGGVEAMFIEQMIPHHDDAIAMAELALDRAEHDEVRALARDIIRTQSAENDLMRQWYRAWFASPVPDPGERLGMMGGGMMGGMTDISALEDAEDFDRAFIEQMIPHHGMGIMMARMAEARTISPELRELTRSIIRTQSDEIEMVQSWYREWYGR
ncbi:MAG: DUF305 domain-containing protein [Coriobacteriia bacterium]|nr:DUF305 domain-containing protein [Coriobacteriia bacterium]MBN2848197.1 DUF305 domain-containing protein [Coriobacteriia bacterium]